MGDVELRKAMGYALNIEEVSEVYYNGLRERANSMIPPVFKSFFDDSLEGYTYDEAKAIEILDAAGYKDVDGDGMREDKTANRLKSGWQLCLVTKHRKILFLITCKTGKMLG